MKATLGELQSFLSGARLENAAPETVFEDITTDSRSASAGKLFVALRGEHYDAHDFLAEVVAKNVAAVMVQQVPPGLKVPAIVLPDTRAGLGEMARWWRSRFALPVIGVTGSNGKTTVKEMIASIFVAAFGEQGSLATLGNFNNDIGVPLTLLRLEPAHRAAVIELGMNHPGEIALLSSIAQPTVGLVNNAQREHLEFMDSVEAVARENGAVIQSLPLDGIAVFPHDDLYASLWRAYAQQTDGAADSLRRVVTFGLSGTADVSGVFTPEEFGSTMTVTAGRDRLTRLTIKLAAAGEHNVLNALAAIACTMAIGVDIGHIVRGLESFSPVKGRLQRRQAVNGAMLIDDTYNANPDSVRVAIDVLAQAESARVLVLGDMGEVGDQGREFHEEIGVYARLGGIQNLLTLGQLASHAARAFGTPARHCQDMESLLTALDAMVTPDMAVLVKGSRFMRMERVIQHMSASDNLNPPTQEAH